MKLLVAVQLCSLLLRAWGRSLLDGKPTSSALEWYIAAEEVAWDYLPGGQNKCKRPEPRLETDHHRDVSEKDPNDHALWTTDGLGTVLKKAAYVQYTDQSFQEAVPKPKEFQHTGLLGPILRVNLGDTVTITFLNRLPFPVNLEPRGLQPASTADGSSSEATFAPAAAPNETVTYSWVVPEAAGPAPDEPAYKLWLYRSTVDGPAHDNAGLLGGILVGRSRDGPAASADSAGGSPPAPESDRDIIMIFQILNENESPFLEDNLAGRTPQDVGLDSEDELHESLLKHAVNGYLFCSGPPLEIQQGERVRWHVATIGMQVDLHNAHWHGNNFLRQGIRDDQILLIPGSVESVVLEAENVGTWWLHCHVNDHITAGMMALYTVVPGDGSVNEEIYAQLNGTVRHYYVAAEEVVWDYAPAGGNLCSGQLEPWSEAEAVFVENGTYTIGSRYLKGQYVEYTDDTFTQKKGRAPEEEYLGLVGPILRAEVGDTILVTFLNRLRYPASMHPHGVRYGKASEGSPYNDGTTGSYTYDDAVPPGEKHTYSWQVPEHSGPGAVGSTRVWMYHSHAAEIQDTYAGLFGAIVVGQRGALQEGTLTAKDVDREIVLMFTVTDENHSLFAEDNWELFLEGGSPEDGTPEHEAFEASNKMHSVNGFVYCNMPPLQFQLEERVRLYVMALGNEVDVHSPNSHIAMHASGRQHTLPALTMVPGSMHTVDIFPRTPGKALVQCGSASHVAAGMAALYEVADERFQGPSSEQKQRQQASRPRYHIAAEPVEWDYAPLGLDGCTGEPFSDTVSVFVGRANGSTIGSRYLKALYRQYSDDSFTQLVPQPPGSGILGPTLHLESGQEFEVQFLNRLPFPANIAFDGGLVALHRGEVAAVQPGESFTYAYKIPHSMAPGNADLSTAAYAYTSSVDQVAHPNAGLIGLLLVALPGTLTNAGRPAGVAEAAASSKRLLPNGSPRSDVPLPTGVDRLVPLLFNIQNENESPFLADNMEMAGVGGEAAGLEEFQQSNLMHSINGYVYCNMPEMTIPLAGTTRFVLLGVGSETDMHSPAFTGQILSTKAFASSAAELMPRVTRVVDIAAGTAAAGRWPFYCNVHEHLVAGMQGMLLVA